MKNGWNELVLQAAVTQSLNLEVIIEVNYKGLSNKVECKSVYKYKMNVL